MLKDYITITEVKMSRLKDLVIDVETHLGSLLNDEGLTNDQALTVI